jgi:hypothetical protein
VISRAEAVRRVLLWTTLLTGGAAWVGMQFGCAHPQTSRSFAGFPHAGRWPVRQAGAGTTLESPQERGMTEAKLYIQWLPSGSPERPGTQTLNQNAKGARDLHKVVSEPVRQGLKPLDKPVSIAMAEPPPVKAAPGV